MSKRRKMMLDMSSAMRVEVRDALATRKVWQMSAHGEEAAHRGALVAELVHQQTMAQPPEWCNVDANFQQAVQAALAIKGAILNASQSTPRRVALEGLDPNTNIALEPQRASYRHRTRKAKQSRASILPASFGRMAPWYSFYAPEGPFTSKISQSGGSRSTGIAVAA